MEQKKFDAVKTLRRANPATILAWAVKAILLSIKPEWAEKIYNGEKTIEWRKSRPRLDRNNHHMRVYIYETAPVKRITGHFMLRGCYELDLGCKPTNAADAFIVADLQRRGCVPMRTW